jgi:hypothetical protein
VVLDPNRPEGLAELYAGVGTAGLALVATFDGGQVRLYQRVELPTSRTPSLSLERDGELIAYAQSSCALCPSCGILEVSN